MARSKPVSATTWANGYTGHPISLTRQPTRSLREVHYERRSHALDVLDCPSCHGRLRLLAVVNDKAEARRFLCHLGRPSEPPTISRARDPTLDAVA